MGQIFGTRYELVDLLASGGAGSVWRVWDRRDQAYRAGKVLRQADSTSLVRFVRETGWRVDHPHVVAPLNWSGEDDRVIFTMPLVRGGSLATVLGDHGQLPVWFVVAVADQVLDALSAVHAHRLVHRDVKPANVLLEPTGTGRPDVRLGDFGIAAPVGDPRLTTVNEVVGTPGYLSPEALAGADPDPRQDVYAVGAMVVELLTGRRPQGTVVLTPEQATTPIGRWIGQLVGPIDQRPTAAAAREQLLSLGLPTGPSGNQEVVEVFDQVPELPGGWGAHGPLVPRDGATAGTPGAPPDVAVGAPTPRPRTTELDRPERTDRIEHRASVDHDDVERPRVLDRIGVLPMVMVLLGIALLVVAIAFL